MAARKKFDPTVKLYGPFSKCEKCGMEVFYRPDYGPHPGGCGGKFIPTKEWERYLEDEKRKNDTLQKMPPVSKTLDAGTEQQAK